MEPQASHSSGLREEVFSALVAGSSLTKQSSLTGAGKPAPTASDIRPSLSVLHLNEPVLAAVGTASSVREPVAEGGAIVSCSAGR